MATNPNLKYKGKKFKKAPLVEAVFEIRFPIELAIDSYKEKFYDSVKDKFPRIELPQPVPFEHHIIQPLNYYSENRTENLVCSVSKFAYITRNYSTFHEFKKASLNYMDLFNKSYSIKKIQRLGVRCINQINFARKDDIIPLNDYMSLRFELPESIPHNSIKDFQTVFIVKISDGTIRSVIGTTKKGNIDILTLDNDIGIIGEFQVGDIDSMLDEAHSKIETIFLEFLTERYLKSIS